MFKTYCTLEWITSISFLHDPVNVINLPYSNGHLTLLDMGHTLIDQSGCCTFQPHSPVDTMFRLDSSDQRGKDRRLNRLLDCWDLWHLVGSRTLRSSHRSERSSQRLRSTGCTDTVCTRSVKQKRFVYYIYFGYLYRDKHFHQKWWTSKRPCLVTTKCNTNHEHKLKTVTEQNKN